MQLFRKDADRSLVMRTKGLYFRQEKKITAMSDIRKLISRKIAYPLQDFYNNTSIISTHQFLL